MDGIMKRWHFLSMFTLVTASAFFLNSCTGMMSKRKPIKTGPSDRMSKMYEERLQREIDRRAGALEHARKQIIVTTPNPELSAWVRDLESQKRCLENLQTDLRTSGSATERGLERSAQKVSGSLLDCLALGPVYTPQGASIIEETSVSWAPVRTVFERGDCMETLRRYRSLVTAYPQSTVPADVQVFRALCLNRSGRRQEAIESLESVLKEKVQLLDFQYLVYLLSNWLFEAGRLGQAEENYRLLLQSASERDRWSELAKLRLDQIDLRRGKPSVAQAGPAKAEAVAPEVTVSPPGSPSSSDIVVSTTEVPSSSRTKIPAAASAKVPDARAAQLEEADRLLDNEHYEESIAAYQDLLGTQYDGLAQQRIQRAQDLYAEKQRREAASLVLQARKESDSQKRKSLLIRALELLQGINDRYPANQYAEKIHRNILDVIRQIQKIDPWFEPGVRTDQTYTTGG
jgi:tetratricopeptide (TPR) repeat protein